MPFFKRLKNSVLSLNKSSNSGGGGLKTNGHANGLGILNKTNMSSVDSFNAAAAAAAELNTTVSTVHANVLNSSSNHNTSTTLNTTTGSSSNAANTTLSSIASNPFFSTSRKDPAYRNLIVYHIDSETEGDFTISVKNDATGEFVIDKVCDHYNLTDYKEYFGLKYTLVDDKGDHEIFWLDPFKTVGKQLRDTNNVLTFRIKHFPGKPEVIESEYVRYLIFLQLRNYLLKGDMQLPIAEEIRLAAYAVQAALGDYEPELHRENYLAELKFLSRRLLKSADSIVEIHKSLHGRLPGEMELAFLERTSKYETYGAELITVKNSKGVSINFGASHNGIITYLSGQSPNVAKISVYPWTQIGKISCERRTLKIHAHIPDLKNSEVINKHVMVFKCSSTRICKHLWNFVLDQKAFFQFAKGADVPKIKSSNSFFASKSKFRFSGRCESELISSQRDVSIRNVSLSHQPQQQQNGNATSMLEVSTTAGPAFVVSGEPSPTDSTSVNRSSSLQRPFKRRTFLDVSRTGSLLRPVVATQHQLLLQQQQHQPIDTNNNTTSSSSSGSSTGNNQNNWLLKKADQLTPLPPPQQLDDDINDLGQLHRRNTLTTLAETVSNKSQLTVIVSDDNMNIDIVPNNRLSSQQQQQRPDAATAGLADPDTLPHFTSTPNNSSSTAAVAVPQQTTVAAVESADETTSVNGEERRRSSQLTPATVDSESSAVTLRHKSSVTSQHKKYMLSSINRARYDGTADDVDAEPAIGDQPVSQEQPDEQHDELAGQSSGNNSLNSSRCSSRLNSSTRVEEKRGKWATTRRRLYSTGKIALVFFFILFLCLLVEFLYCKTMHYDDAAYSCSGQIMNTVRNRVSGGAANANRWISWVNVDNSRCQLLDPIFSWFFTKHRTN